MEKFGFDKADLMVLFGGSIIAGGDVLAAAMGENIAKKYVIVGGEGHTTPGLRQAVHNEFPSVNTHGKPEAEVFAGYLFAKYGLKPDLLECDSTNCGNNITFLLKLLEEKGVEFESIILAQDATMQRRIEAGLKKFCPDVTVISFATYKAEVLGNPLTYSESIHGMWDVSRYTELLMGEIPRLTDDEKGYGPRGKGFISHVDIPPEVSLAFNELCKSYRVRQADPLYAVRGDILKYIKSEILPMYESFDGAHGTDHVKDVIKNSMEIACNYDVSPDMVYVIAAYHDTGIKFGRKNHNITSAKLLFEDEILKGWFTQEQIVTMQEAVEDHRASSDHEPRSIYGRIISEADRDIDPIKIIQRIIQYRKDNCPNASEDENFEDAYKHFCEKYGKNGYLKLWLHTKRNAEGLEKLRQWESDREEFLRVYSKLIKEMGV